ncbi:MAG: hypothetical protein ACTSRA_00690 [Promethearchaeota archaeon]|nr:MAG: hypothetical protein [Helarchaeota virus Nidhogg Meg22_1012]URC17475.1 MAG: hypothetical protein [Helarchaeota virus Nidhogg Meg22_1214]
MKDYELLCRSNMHYGKHLSFSCFNNLANFTYAMVKYCGEDNKTSQSTYVKFAAYFLTQFFGDLVKFEQHEWLYDEAKRMIENG